MKKAQFKNICKSSDKETHRMLKVEGEDGPDYSLTSKTPLKPITLLEYDLEVLKYILKLVLKKCRI